MWWKKSFVLVFLFTFWRRIFIGSGQDHPRRLHRHVAVSRRACESLPEKSSDPEFEFGKGLGTGARLRALAEGKIHIALASHGIEPAEIQKGNLQVIQIAKGAIVFAVNGVAMTNMTEEQICGVYSGKIATGRAWALHRRRLS